MTTDGKALTRFALSTLTRERLCTINLSNHQPNHRLSHAVSLQVDCLFSRTYLRSKLFWDNGCSANKDACRRTDASPHTDTAFDDLTGSFARIGSKCPKLSLTLHRHRTDLPPPARPTSQAGTGLAYSQVARSHYTGSRAWRAQPRKGRACMHRSTQSED
jgi:hypothetical protein